MFIRYGRISFLGDMNAEVERKNIGDVKFGVDEVNEKKQILKYGRDVSSW